ncbi:MAG: ABC transporter ATP-binding protein [Planctomycetota bacterium]
MSKHTTIRVEDLSKSYTIQHQAAVQPTTLGEAVMSRLRKPIQRAEKETFFAIKDVSFEVERGDVVGIVGRNGAGKSTLLKLLSRIAAPTEGRITLRGRVGSLLEVGTGFHPELTGRENIYLNGGILGMRRREITQRFDQIVDFAGVEKFLDTPVKRYSSGMYVRLAFAVAAHLSSEILVVDEVLAVGDAEFQKQCLGKMKDVANSGRTVLFVSHNVQSVAVLCNKGLYLEKGHLLEAGGVDQIIQRYVHSFAGKEKDARDFSRRPGSGEYRVTRFAPTKPVFDADETKSFDFRIEHQHGQAGRWFVTALISDSMGVTLAQCDSRVYGGWFEDCKSLEGSFSFRGPWLKPGEYRVDVWVQKLGPRIDEYQGAANLQISPVYPYPDSVPHDGTQFCQVLSDFAWEAKVVDPLRQQVAAVS